MASIAEKVAKLRSEHRWTLQKLSSMTGISVSHLSAIEHGSRPNPSFFNVVKLAQVFEVPIDYFADDFTHSVEQRDQSQRFLEHVQRLYDPETQAFIVSERSRPYVYFAKQLAEQGSQLDASVLLNVIAEFIREQKQAYGDMRVMSDQHQ